MMLPVLLVAMAPMALASPMQMGRNQCTWGPTYWCANIPQASECGAVKHCIKAVWEKQTVPKDDDEVCTICKEMVGEARDTLMSNETQEELKEVFDGSCDLIPIGLVAKECRALFDQFVPELVETLASEMNPDTVCTVSGLCNSGRIDRLLEAARAQRHTGGDCLLCREGAVSTKLQLEGESKSEVEDRLLELCGYFGSYVSACRATVLEKSQEVYSYLTSQPWEAGVCDLSGMCSQAFDSVAMTPIPEASEDIQCEFCEKVIAHWVDVYASNASLAEFKAMLDGFCDKVDKHNSEHCRHIVDDYYIPAFNFLRNEVNPHALCSLVGLCPASQDFLVTHTHIQRIQPQVSQVSLVPAVRNSLTMESSSCDMCQAAMTEVFELLKDPYDQNMVKNVLESVCYRLPSLVERRCEDFVEGYTAKILDLITSGIDPDYMCVALSVCEPQEEEELVQEEEEQIEDNTCVLCEYVVTTLDGMVTDKSNEAEIKAALDTLCSYMPQSVSKQCTVFVDTYTDMIIDMLTKDVTPEMICTNLGLCDNNLAKTIRMVEVETLRTGGPRVGGAYCTLCDVVISNLDSQLQDKTNEDEIKDALDVLCTGLSTPVHKECIKLVSQYTEEIVAMIVNDYPPHVICSELGLCVDHEISSNAIPQVEDLVTVRVPTVVEASVPCEMCEFAVKVLDERLGDTATIDQVEREVQFVCSYLPGSIGDTCEQLVDKYGDKLIAALIKEEMDPKKVCSSLLPSCSSQQSQPHPCPWGPDMWCASPFHARVCGATAACGY